MNYLSPINFILCVILPTSHHLFENFYLHLPMKSCVMTNLTTKNQSCCFWMNRNRNLVYCYCCYPNCFLTNCCYYYSLMIQNSLYFHYFLLMYLNRKFLSYFYYTPVILLIQIGFPDVQSRIQHFYF